MKLDSLASLTKHWNRKCKVCRIATASIAIHTPQLKVFGLWLAIIPWAFRAACNLCVLCCPALRLPGLRIRPIPFCSIQGLHIELLSVSWLHKALSFQKYLNITSTSSTVLSFYCSWCKDVKAQDKFIAHNILLLRSIQMWKLGRGILYLNIWVRQKSSHGVPKRFIQNPNPSRTHIPI